MQDGRPGGRRRRVAAAVVAGGLAVAGLLVLAPPAVVTGWFADPRTSPVAGQPVPPITEVPAVRIAVTGDTGTGSPAAYRTARRMLLESRAQPYDALLLLGDLVYDRGEAAEVERVVLRPFSPVVGGGAVLLPVLGNHDYESGQQQEILAALGRSTSWYVAQVGPVQVVVLDSNRVDDPEQRRWLQATLSLPRPPGTWTVAAMHHPAYSAGYHGSELPVREQWGPLFEQHDVALVLAGHDHDYQRSTVLDGVTYVVSGAGAKVRPVGRRPFTAVSSPTLHYLDLLVYEDRLVGRAIGQSGRLVDLFTVSRGAASAAAPDGVRAADRGPAAPTAGPPP